MNNKEIKKELEEIKELLKGAHRDSRMFPEMSRELISQAIAKTENLTNILKGREHFRHLCRMRKRGRTTDGKHP